MENPKQEILWQTSSEGWAGNGLELGREMAGESRREKRLSPLQNGGVHRTHSFPTAWCTSVRPWGSSSGPWGRPESAWSWGEKRAQGMPDRECQTVGTAEGWAPQTHWAGSTPAHPSLSCLCSPSGAGEQQKCWIFVSVTPFPAGPAADGVSLQCCLGLCNKGFPHQTVLLPPFPCCASGSQQAGLAESPSPLSGTLRCISRDWHCS